MEFVAIAQAMLGLLASHAEWPAGKGALLPRGPSTCNLTNQHCTDALPGAILCFPILGFRAYVFEV